MELIFAKLCALYGVSAATTYLWNRERHKKPAIYCYLAMLSQVDELGRGYAGGLDCTKHRH